MKKTILFTAALAMVAFMCNSAVAGILAQESWSSPPDLVDWEINPHLGPNPGATVVNDTGFGNLAGALCVEVSHPGGAPSSGLLSTDSGSFLGDYTANAGHTISFDFFFDEAAFAATDGLSLFFNNSGANWYYEIDLSGQAANTWATYTVNFGSETGWSDEGGGAPSFSTAAAGVTQIGFRLNYLDGVAGQKYGVDNLTRTFNVPEPETYAALGFALISICITFRRKITDTLATVGLIKA
jgi:hypothetical protein